MSLTANFRTTALLHRVSYSLHLLSEVAVVDLAFVSSKNTGTGDFGNIKLEMILSCFDKQLNLSKGTN